MKPHLRVRKTVKWGGAVIVVLLVALWIYNGWWSILFVNARSATVIADSGRLLIGPVRLTEGERRWLRRWPSSNPGRFRWGLSVERAHMTRQIAIPLWFPTALCVISASAAWRFDIMTRRRTHSGNCPSCNHNLAGLARECSLSGVRQPADVCIAPKRVVAAIIEPFVTSDLSPHLPHSLSTAPSGTNSSAGLMPDFASRTALSGSVIDPFQYCVRHNWLLV